MYLHYILSKEDTLKFVMFHASIEYETGAEYDYFQRSSTWDDIKIILPFKYLFELIDRIKLNRLEGLTLEQINKVVDENHQRYCCDYEILDEEFIIRSTSTPFNHTSNGLNLSDILPILIEAKYKNNHHNLI